MPIYLFFDLDTHLVREIKKHVERLQYPVDDWCDSPIQFQFYNGDVRNLKDNVDVFISPANSYGYMDGGIDEIYSEMYPGIQDVVQNQIRQISPVKGKLLLPIGAAFRVPLDQQGHQSLIVAPTMEVPHSIKRNPENVYYAMVAILKVTKDLPSNTIVAIPGLGTGVGALSAEEAAAQIYYAFDTVLNFKAVNYPEPVGLKYQADDHYLLDTQIFF